LRRWARALPNSEIFRRLAARWATTNPASTESDEAILRDFVAAQTHPRFAGLTWERLLAEGFYRVNLPEPYLPFAEGNFPTPSGKCEFYSARMAADGYDPAADIHAAALASGGRRPSGRRRCQSPIANRLTLRSPASRHPHTLS
jgi:predicted molibdopterin-dependent oxidoreductase YjgC